MSVELKIPSVGESITQVTIASWLKEDGDYVEMDEAVAELESDKATVELNAEQSGILKIIVEEGEDVEIDAVVASIDTSAEPPAEKAAPAQKESTQAKEEPAPKTEVVEKNTSSSYATGTPSPAANKIIMTAVQPDARAVGNLPDERFVLCIVQRMVQRPKTART